MIFFYGARSAKIKKYEDPHVKCENCSEYKSRFIVQQRYAHLFWIPLFPISKKYVYGECGNCGQDIYDEKASNYLAMTRTPWYLFLGTIFFIMLIFSIFYGSHVDNKNKAEYIQNPMMGDVYLIRVDSQGSKVYFFMKVDEVQTDSVKLLFGAYEYSRYTSKMTNEDYFNKDDYEVLSKEELVNMLDNGTINSIKR